MRVKRKNKQMKQVTYSGDSHPTCGTVFTITWKVLQQLIEHNFKSKKEKVVSIKICETGLDVFTNSADMTAHYPLKEEVYEHV